MYIAFPGFLVGFFSHLIIFEFGLICLSFEIRQTNMCKIHGTLIRLLSNIADLIRLLAVYIYALSTPNISKVQVRHKLLISQSKFSGSRKFTLRYQKFVTTEVEM